MKFEEILPALRAGKKVMSYSIDCEYIYIIRLKMENYIRTKVAK